LGSSRISCPWSSAESLPAISISGTSGCLQRGSGQWGLLGGSSNAAKTKPKLSKLASLAKSNRGSSDKKGIQHKWPSSTLDSVARLSSLSSAPRVSPRSSSSTSVALPQQDASSIALEKQSECNTEHQAVEATVDHRADHLLARPSILAGSLFHFWEIPQNAASLLRRIYANTSLLTVVGNSQPKNAFEAPSPDDIVQNAQQRNKGTVTHC